MPHLLLAPSISRLGESALRDCKSIEEMTFNFYYWFQY